jgi:hypothetical protein
MRFSHKRSWAAMALSMYAFHSSAASLSMSPRQHRVRSARRKVPYQHVLEERSRDPLPAFWAPSREEAKSTADVNVNAKAAVDPWREKSSRSGEHGHHHADDTHWHLAVDASLEHPDTVYRQVRRSVREHEDERAGKGQRQRRQDPVSTGVSTWADAVRRLLRPQLQVSDFVTAPEATSAAFDAAAAEAADKNSPNDTISSKDEFNVTAEVAYNVSSDVDEGIGNRTNDTSSAVFTQSESQNYLGDSTDNGADIPTDIPADIPTDDTESKVVYKPLRIRAVLAEREGGGEHLDERQHEILLQDIIRPALLSWSAALRVEPVVGNLTVDAEQLNDGVSCGPGIDSGLPSVNVPFSHFNVGVPDTDLIVYLSLGFVETNETTIVAANETNEVKHRSGVATQVNAAQVVSEAYLNSTYAMPLNETSSLPQVKVNETSSSSSSSSQVKVNQTSNAPAGPAAKRTCTGEYLAASSFCSTDQYDRPTAAILHICIGESFFNVSSLLTSIMTVSHELGHILGFNQQSMAHFRRPDGSPITPRGKDGEIPVTEVECTGTTEFRHFANVSLPSEDILQFRTVRGGVRVAEIVTPSVQQAVRNHFDCQELPGAELESGESLPLSSTVGEISCLGDHWERRLFKSDLLNPIVDGLEFNPRISTTTLAFFADSGWYQVDLSRSSLSASWGRGAGCAFVEENCINNDGQVPPSYEPYFCNEGPGIDSEGYATEINGCTPDLSRKASCSIGQYISELPPEYQYFNFTHGANVGGSDAFMDYCPVFSGFSNGLCSDHNNEALIRVNRMEKIGSRNSRCLAGQDRNSAKTALCLPIACVVEDRSLRVQIDGTWRVCGNKDQELLSRSGDRVICPDPIRVCPTFYCDRDCLGTRGWCNYETGKCTCSSAVAAPQDAISLTSFSGNYHCEQEIYKENGQAIFFTPKAEDDVLPDSDSPLADYYVPTARNLRDEPDRLLKLWTIPVVTLVGAVVGVFLLIYVFRRKPGTEQTAGVEPGTDDSGNDAANPNKAKMLATVVLDMRMNNPSLRAPADVLLERSSETDLSLTDTEGSGARALGDGSLDGMPPVEIETPSSPSTIRRRNIFDHK